MQHIVETNAGAVRGTAAHGVVTFKGVPYGADTSGAGRFRPAGAPQPWAGVRECIDYGPSCPQVRVGQMVGRELPPEVEEMRAVWNAERVMAEDCLVVNVWTPAVGDSRQRPVLVWLHGGGMSVGSASWPLYDFTKLAASGDVVVVSLNHRVGILGFLDLSHLGEPYADSGNVGMLDIVRALAWVRDNITAFGGDASNVTVFGESGGGSKLTCLLGMPAARGLFQRAFVMSGALLRARTPELATSTTDVALQALGGAGGSGSPLEASWAELVAAEVEVLRAAGPLIPGRARAVFGPALGPSLPCHPLDAVRSGDAAGVQVVIGCTTHEGLLGIHSPGVWFGGDAAVRNYIDEVMGDDADHLLETYRAANPDDSMLSLLVLMASDRLMRIPHIRFAEALLDGGASTWMYLFDFRQPLVPGLPPLAGHGSDMPYIFDNVHLAPSAQVPGADTVAAAMSRALLAFARHGNPSHAAIPAWPAYDPAGRPTMMFDATSRVEHDPMAAARLAWDAVALGAGLA